MNFGDLVFATSPETGMFYGIYVDEDHCWKYRTYVTDLSNIDNLLRIFRAVKKHPCPADGSGRRKVEVFRPVL